MIASARCEPWLQDLPHPKLELKFVAHNVVGKTILHSEKRSLLKSVVSSVGYLPIPVEIHTRHEFEEATMPVLN